MDKQRQEQISFAFEEAPPGSWADALPASGVTTGLAPDGGARRNALQPPPGASGNAREAGQQATPRPRARTPIPRGREDQKAHRARLRARFMADGGAAMPDYELLELLLFRAIPRREVKPLAKRLLASFGDLAGVLGAEPDQICTVEGAGPAVATELRLAAAIAARMGRARLLRRDVISSWDALLDYCQTAMAHRQTEQFRVLFLDRKNVLIADEEQGRGTVDHVPVYPREIVRRALVLNASAVILVHNHPSGDPTPSRADEEMTQAIVTAARTLGIAVHDHLVIGKGQVFSFRAEGML